jgi:hypothetical protein
MGLAQGKPLDNDVRSISHVTDTVCSLGVDLVGFAG